MSAIGMMARGLGLGGLVATLAGTGCTVGSGSGKAEGDLFILGCDKEGNPYGAVDLNDPTMVQPMFYNLRPSFFAGEPIEDTSSGVPTNRLIIRMQRDGRGIEVNDTLYFDIRNTFEVARCVRGRIDNGVPDWLPDDRVLDYRGERIENWCDWSAGGENPRIRLHPDGLIRASLVPLDTCPIPAIGAGTGGARVTGIAVDGWIQFTVFGSANQPTLPAEMRSELSADYKVAFEDDLEADFDIPNLADERTVLAPRRLEPVPPFQRMGGHLTGEFEFKFLRGRAAQAFQ
jgi:hypothetical protein